MIRPMVSGGPLALAPIVSGFAFVCQTSAGKKCLGEKKCIHHLLPALHAR